MRAWLWFLSVVVVVQGGLLGFCLYWIHARDKVLVTFTGKKVIDVPEIRTRTLTVSSLVLQDTKGRPVGGLTGGGDNGWGPTFSLMNIYGERYSSNLRIQMMPESTEVLMQQEKHGGGGEFAATGRLHLSLHQGRTRLQVEPAYHYHSGDAPLSIGCGYAQNTPESIPYYLLGYSIPGFPDFRYPRELPALQEELATLTPATDEAKQRALMRELNLEHALTSEFPQLAKLCETYPAEKDFPRGYVDYAVRTEGYQPLVLESLDRKPSCMMAEILARLACKELDEIGKTDLRDRFLAFAARTDLPPEVKSHANSWAKGLRDRPPREITKPEPKSGD